ncbi:MULTISPECIES: hypothetical protein [Pseudomonas]|uniref:hypothetical protein n=1 Tax=Pseudomonas TaxID=286 RepID=UPI0027422633|nr:hypothetical protein [Pseudomonas gingeri]
MHIYLGTSRTVSVDGLKQAVGFVLGNIGLRQSLAERSRRFAVALASSALKLRQVTLEDARLLFEGRNQPSVRSASLNSAPIDWDAHRVWLAAKLRDPGCLLLVAEAQEGPVGVLRYDLAVNRAEVSLYLLDGRAGLAGAWTGALRRHRGGAEIPGLPPLALCRAGPARG